MATYLTKVSHAARDASARLDAFLQIPSKRSLLQHNEDAKGEVSTQYAQEALKR